jgi:hypothetical protein
MPVQAFDGGPLCRIARKPKRDRGRTLAAILGPCGERLAQLLTKCPSNRPRRCQFLHAYKVVQHDFVSSGLFPEASQFRKVTLAEFRYNPIATIPGGSNPNPLANFVPVPT